MMNRAVWIASRRLVRAPTVASRCLGTQIYDSGSVTVSNLLKTASFMARIRTSFHVMFGSQCAPLYKEAYRDLL
jgi:hypothetical protein